MASLIRVCCCCCRRRRCCYKLTDFGGTVSKDCKDNKTKAKRSCQARLPTWPGPPNMCTWRDGIPATRILEPCRNSAFTLPGPDRNPGSPWFCNKTIYWNRWRRGTTTGRRQLKSSDILWRSWFHARAHVFRWPMLPARRSADLESTSNVHSRTFCNNEDLWRRLAWWSNCVHALSCWRLRCLARLQWSRWSFIRLRHFNVYLHCADDRGKPSSFVSPYITCRAARGWKIRTLRHQ